MKTCYDIVLKSVTNKDVLDIGSCGNQGEQKKSKTLFELLKNKAKSVTGVDIESNTPEIIRGDAETIKLNKKFDIVVAGDVIGHLHNAGLFLDNIHSHLKNNGLMLIATPNSQALAYSFLKVNEFHTCWYCKHTLKYLIQQHNFTVEKIFFSIRRKKNPIYDILKYFLANHMLFICKKKNI